MINVKKKPISVLLTFCFLALAEKWGYVWGTIGRVLTEPLLLQKIKQYPIQVGKKQATIRKKWLGKKTTDCVDLIKGAYWHDGAGNIDYKAETDITLYKMFSEASESGPISTIKLGRRGLCLYKPGHVGVYIGLENGKPFVIEANSTDRGVIKTPLLGVGATPWTHWFVCDFFEAPKDETVKPPVKPTPKPMVIKQGAKGEAVRMIQLKLTKLGYTCVADGDYGPKTTAAVAALQKANQIKTDPAGCVGSETQKVLDRG